MTREEIVRMARDTGSIDSEGVIETMYAAFAAVEREACARIAESLWRQYQDTKDARERMSLEPLMLGRFGFDQSAVQQSRRIAAAIRARSQP